MHFGQTAAVTPCRKNKKKKTSRAQKIKTKNQNFAHLFTPGRTHGAPFVYFVVGLEWVLEIACSMLACLFVCLFVGWFVVACLFCWPCISIAFELCRRVIENLSRQNRRARARLLASMANFPISKGEKLQKACRRILPPLPIHPEPRPASTSAWSPSGPVAVCSTTFISREYP